MKLKNAFSVAQPPDVVWPVLNDIERIAPCLPGAELLESREDGTYVGRVGLRLGPVDLTFKGNVAYAARDDEARTASVKARGNDERGRGTARATVAFAAHADGDNATNVEIDTDLMLVGAIAQYARGKGMIETTAQVLIDDFASNLEALLTAPEADAASAPEAMAGQAEAQAPGSQAQPQEASSSGDRAASAAIADVDRQPHARDEPAVPAAATPVATAPSKPVAAAKPISGLRLMWRVVLRWLGLDRARRR
ncbi:MAG: SRPBCC domain-containing protein [Pseudomonadota bacterium]